MKKPQVTSTYTEYKWTASKRLNLLANFLHHTLRRLAATHCLTRGCSRIPMLWNTVPEFWYPNISHIVCCGKCWTHPRGIPNCSLFKEHSIRRPHRSRKKTRLLKNRQGGLLYTTHHPRQQHNSSQITIFYLFEANSLLPKQQPGLIVRLLLAMCSKLPPRSYQ